MESANVDLSVIAPCLNEAPNIRPLAERVGAALAAHPGGFELVIVDDGSRDATFEEIERAARDFPFVVPARHRVNRGIPESWRTGLAACRGRRVVTIDSDLQYRPEDIPRLVAAMDETGAEFVQGWRQTQVRRGLLRKVLTAGLSGLLSAMFGAGHLRDNKSGFVLYSRDALSRVLDYRRPFRYYQHFIGIAAIAHGLRIAQVPIVFDERAAGESFIHDPLRFSMRALADLPRAVMEFGVFRRRAAAVRDA
ncbi:glycosyltransferase family 2 protein [bacterium]|nr:glycosyltransferase family 2 protein [bacterium]